MKNNIRFFDRLKSFINSNYSLIFIFIVYISIIFKNVVYVGMCENPNHFQFSFIIGIKEIGIRIIPLMISNCFIVSFSLLMKGKFRYFYLLIVSLISTILIFGTLSYVRTYQGAPSFFWLVTPKNELNNVSTSIWLHYSLSDALYLIDIVLIIYLLVFGLVKNKFNYNCFTKKMRLYPLACSLFLLISFSLFFPTKTLNESNSAMKVAVYGNVLYHAIDIAQTPNYDSIIEMDEEEVEEYKTFINTLSLNTTQNDVLNLNGILKDSNLIVFQLESFESFVIGNKINGVEITPNINKLLNNCLQLNVHEQVKTGNSSDFDLMFMTSQYPITKVVTFNQYYESELFSLAEVLKKSDYNSVYLNGSIGSTWNYEDVIGPIMGFDNVYFGDSVPEEYIDDTYNIRKCGGYIADKVLLKHNNDLLMNLKNLGNKFYSHTVFCSTHLPFLLPPEIDKAFLNDNLQLKEELGDYLYNYISLCHYVDEAIGFALDELEKKSLLENSTIVILGDHGGPNKYISNRMVDKISDNDKYKWMNSPSNITVPAIIYNKNIDGYNVIGDNGDIDNYNGEIYPKYYKKLTCGQIDILPTLAYMFDITEEFTFNKDGLSLSTMMGRNLLKSNLDFAILSNDDVIGTIPEELSILEKGQYISNLLIKSQYFGCKKKVYEEN